DQSSVRRAARLDERVERTAPFAAGVSVISLRCVLARDSVLGQELLRRQTENGSINDVCEQRDPHELGVGTDIQPARIQRQLKDFEKEAPGDTNEQRPAAEEKTECDAEGDSIEQMESNPGAVHRCWRGVGP